jgi:glyceraldehyde 3-phosphate dehydrogenase
MEPPRVAINGFGRIGRLVARALLEGAAGKQVDLVAVNDIAAPDMLAHLFEFDTIHGRWPGKVEVRDGHLRLDGDEVLALKEADPAALPWRDLRVDYAVEATGKFRTREALQQQLDAGARRVLLTAPAKKGGADVTLVRGVNMHRYDPQQHRIVSNSSCTTNALAVVLKVLHETFGVAQAVMTTVHAYTNDQRVLDAAHKDFRRARAAAMNIVPTTTGAATAISEVMPELQGRIDGLAVRVPVANVSLLDLTAHLERGATKGSMDEAFHRAAEGPLKGILAAEWRSLVSSDFNHHPASAIVDLPGSEVVDHELVKVLAWYDNEWAYARRVAEVLGDLWALEERVEMPPAV